jgi:hypothetical protein
VHSLTARSVSKQFREGLKLAQPHTADINIKLKNSTKSNNNKECRLVEINEIQSENVVSSEHNEVNGGTRNLEGDSSPGELNRKKGGSSSNILARAAFWDKRVQEQIIDDKIVREFPKMEI